MSFPEPSDYRRFSTRESSRADNESIKMQCVDQMAPKSLERLRQITQESNWPCSIFQLPAATRQQRLSEGEPMSSVRVLVGTHKGAFVLTSDGKRKDWEVSGPHFAGWEIYHIKGSPVAPNRIYASQTSGWFGQVSAALRRWRPHLGAGRQQVCLRRCSRHAPVV